MPDPAEAIYNVSTHIKRAIQSTPDKVGGVIKAGAEAVKGNAAVIKDVIPWSVARLTGIPLAHINDLKEDELNYQALRDKGLNTGYSSYYDSLNRLPQETKDRNKSIGKIQAAIDAAIAVVFPNIFAEKYMDRNAKLNDLRGIETEEVERHLGGKPLTRAAKTVADIGARAIPAAAVLLGNINPLEGLLISEGMTVANTLVSDFAYGWRRRITEEREAKARNAGYRK